MVLASILVVVKVVVDTFWRLLRKQLRKMFLIGKVKVKMTFPRVTGQRAIRSIVKTQPTRDVNVVMEWHQVWSMCRLSFNNFQGAQTSSIWFCAQFFSVVLGFEAKARNVSLLHLNRAYMQASETVSVDFVPNDSTSLMIFSQTLHRKHLCPP